MSARPYLVPACICFVAAAACSSSSSSTATATDGGSDGSSVADGGSSTIDLSPTTGQKTAGVGPQSFGYLVTFSQAVTITGIDLEVSDGASPTYATHVWDPVDGSVLATGTTISVVNGNTWYHSNLSFSAGANKQYIVGGKGAFAGWLWQNISLPYTVGPVTVSEFCESTDPDAGDVGPRCDKSTASGVGIRLTVQ